MTATEIAQKVREENLRLAIKNIEHTLYPSGKMTRMLCTCADGHHDRTIKNLMEILREKDEALDHAGKVVNEKYNPHIEVFKLDEKGGGYLAQRIHKIQKDSGYIRIIIS